jgi:hypothetical protein
MPSNGNGNKSCNLTLTFLGFIVTVFSMPFFIINLIKYEQLHDYHLSTCNITRVDYPQTFPTEESSNFWIECDCGRRCVSLYPCVSLYTDINRNNILDSYDMRNRNTECTFYDESCPNGENPISTSRYLAEAQDLATEYENKTVPCYIHNHDPQDNEVYLNFDDNLGDLIGSSVFLGIGILMVCGSIIRFYIIENNYCVKTVPSEDSDKELDHYGREVTYCKNNAFNS